MPPDGIRILKATQWYSESLLPPTSALSTNNTVHPVCTVQPEYSGAVMVTQRQHKQNTMLTKRKDKQRREIKNETNFLVRISFGCR